MALQVNKDFPEYKELDGQWIKGVASLYPPTFVSQGEYAWLLNGDNAGGIISPRPGFNAMGVGDPNGVPSLLTPRGMTIFKDLNGDIHLVVACGDSLWRLTYPFTGPFVLIDGNIGMGSGPVTFTRVFWSFTLDSSGNKVVVPGGPYQILVIQDGISRAHTWNGTGFPIAEIAPTWDPLHPEVFAIPIGMWGQWSGDRYWVSNGSRLHASDLGDPLHFSEETYVAGGGALVFDADITGLNQTNNLLSLLVGTEYDMSAVQSAVSDRVQWANTPGFQQVIVPGIGVASGRSFTRQWGMVWWQAPGGLIALDQALNTYRTSNVSYQDQGMAKQKSKLNHDLSGVVLRPFGNYLIAGVPYASKNNSQLWVLNQRPLDVAQPTLAEAYRVPVWSAAWNGLHPIDMAMQVINGQQRLFALSVDSLGAGTVWELFTGERRDRYNVSTSNPPIVFATRSLLLSDDLKKFEYADLDFMECSGTIEISVLACGRKGSWHLIMSKRVVASRGSINSVISTAAKAVIGQPIPEGGNQITVDLSSPFVTGLFLPGPSEVYVRGAVIPYSAFTVVGNTGTFTCTVPFQLNVGDQVLQTQFTPETIFSWFRPQLRMLRTSKWTDAPDPTCAGGCGVESTWNDRIDRGFQIMVLWSGQATLEGIRAFGSKFQERAYGKLEDQELQARSLSQLGCGQISLDIIEPETTTSASRTGQVLPVFTSRILDVDYSAADLALPPPAPPPQT